MFQRYALFFGLCLPFQPSELEVPKPPIETVLRSPYSEVLKLATPPYPRNEVKSLRTTIQDERDRVLKESRRLEDDWQEQLDATRTKLKNINESSSRDTPAMADLRVSLHTEVAALQQVIQSRQNEREFTIPAAFDVRLAKLELIEQWPARCDQINRDIDAGRARRRSFGDVEDIGYRNLVDEVDQQKADAAIGKEALAAMMSSGQLPREIQDSEIQRYVRDLAVRIARNSDLKVPVQPILLESSEINAMGLPGGFILVTSGLILASENEAGLAGVLSREIARVAARHTVRATRRSMISRIFAPAVQIASGIFTGGTASAGVYYGVNYGAQGLSLLVDRALSGPHGNAGKYEEEADRLGIQYAWKAGFDPKGFIAFLDSIAKNERYTQAGKFFPAKPELGQRVVAAFSEIEFLPDKTYTVDSPEFRTVKGRLAEYAAHSPDSKIN